MRGVRRGLCLLLAPLFSLALLGSAELFLVTAEGVNLRRGPGVETPVIGRVSRGMVFAPQEEGGGWVKVVFPDKGKNLEGYLFENYLQRLDGSLPLTAAKVKAIPWARIHLDERKDSPVVALFPEGTPVQLLGTDDKEMLPLLGEVGGYRWFGFIHKDLVEPTLTLEAQ